MAELRVKWVPVGEVRPYPGNPRRNEAAVDAVAASIREFGWRQPIVVDADGTIVCGHTRYKAAQALGEERVPVTVAADLTPEQVAAYRLADNKVGELAEWDEGLLALELDGLQGFDMGRFGFDLGDMGLMGDEPDLDSVVEDEAPSPDEVVCRCKPGEVWVLGDHRVMCGSATSAEDMGRLGGGALSRLLLTDPPYNVSYQGATADALTIENDSWGSDAEFVGFLRDAFSNAMALMEPGAAFYIWHADTQRANFQRACAEAGMSVRQCLIWNKGSLVLGRQDYQWKHEPCLYGWKEGAAHYFTDSRRETTVVEDSPDLDSMKKDELLRWAKAVLSERRACTVIDCEKPARNGEHPTMKPVRLMAYLVGNSTRPGDTVLDCFAGSGSTLVACEQMGRRCLAMELDPRYCDVILTRWEAFTGRRAERER